MTVGRGIIIWGANNAGEVSAFRQSELPQILAKISDAGLGKAANPEAAAVAEINFVGIQFENLLLGETLLESERNHGFRYFAAKGALIAQEKSARHLHGNGAGALEMIAGMAQIRPGRAHDAHEIEAPVLKEALIFRG